MFKKLALGFALFALGLFISLLLNFPMESLVRHYLADLEKNQGITVNYANGTFHLTNVKLEDVEILNKGVRTFTFSELDISFSPFGVALLGKKPVGSVKINLGSSSVKAEFDNFPVVTDGTKFFKNINATGNFLYKKGPKTGTGKMKLALKDSLDAMIKTDIQAESDVRLTEGEMSMDITSITGMGLSGTGMLVVTFDKKQFGNSRLSGNMNLNYDGTKVNLKVSGTVDNPSAVPSLGTGKNGD